MEIFQPSCEPNCMQQNLSGRRDKEFPGVRVWYVKHGIHCCCYHHLVTSPYKQISNNNKNPQRSLPWPSGLHGESVVSICQGCGFNPQLEHVQEATSQCMDGWNSKIDLFLSSKIKKSIQRSLITILRTEICH